MARKYAEGRHAWGICMRSGRKMFLRDMILDGRYPNLRVDPEWYEPRHPLEFLAKVDDPIALYRPSPEVIFAPTAPVLTVIPFGTSLKLTWTPAESNITEIRSYTIFRGVDGATPILLLLCNVQRDFLGGIIGVQHCTTVPSVPDDDTGELVDKVIIEDSPISYVDAAVTVGHTYCYYITAVPLGNNQSVAQGPQISSATVCAVAVVPTATTPVLTAVVLPYPDILLNWTASTVSDGTITNYQIFRQSDGGAFSLLTTVGNVLTYLDTTEPVGHLYGYFVVAIPSIGNNSGNSNVASVPLSNDPFFDNVVLLLHVDGTNGQTTTVDSSIVNNVVSINGAGSLSTVSPKFGTASFFRPSSSGANDAVVSAIALNSPLDILPGNVDFTIEGWINISSGGHLSIAVDYGGDQVSFGGASGSIALQVPVGTSVSVFLGTTAVDSVTHVAWQPLSVGVANISTGQWYHWAIQRVNGFAQVFFDGVGSSINSSAWRNYTRPSLGSFAAFGYTASISSVDACRLDEIRVTRGIGRYSGSTYTVPTAPTAP